METSAQDTLSASQEPTSFFDSLRLDATDLLLPVAGKLLVAILMIIVGFWIVRRIIKIEVRLMEKRNVDQTLRPFLQGFTNFMFKAVILIAAISTLGVEMTSLIAVLGSIGLAIGLALQGSLANFAGGVLILVLKPFQKGDLIEAQGVFGVVEEINIINTTLTTLDYKTVYLPNGPLAGDVITNYTHEEFRRVDMTFGIGYGDDIKKAQKIFLDIIAKCPHAVDGPEPPFAKVGELGDSSVNFTVRVWCKAADYFDTFFYMQEQVKLELDAQGITIPFPQRDVHLFPQNTNPEAGK